MEAHFFHFFRDYESIIFIESIGHQIINDNIFLVYTFLMDFDNHRYTFIGKNNLHITKQNINKIRELLLKKERKVLCKGIENNSIILDFKLTPTEYDFINN